jgi:hypothetical protein
LERDRQVIEEARQAFAGAMHGDRTVFIAALAAGWPDAQ